MSASPKRIAVLMLVSVLASCSTPREQCIDAARADYVTVARTISETRQTIARGYALHRERVPYRVHDICYGYDRHARYATPYSCFRTAYRTQTTPVAVDIAEERKKLARYERLLPKLRAEAAAGIAQCDARYPAEP